MKKMSKIMGLTIGALLISNAYAQSAPPFDPNASIAPFTSGNVNPSIGQSALQTTNVAPPTNGNVYEREVTPLLREVSKKKVELEIKKLDAELEKVDAEILKLQKEKVAPSSNNNNIGGRIINPQDINNPVMSLPPMSQQQVNIPAPQQAPQPTVVAANETSGNIRVLMVLGFDNDLYAKISSGDQGGYVVRKGDILPDGRTVTAIKPTYIMVSKNKAANSGQRIYVSGPAPVNPNGGGTSISPSQVIGGNAGSASIAPPTIGPMSLPGMVTTSTNVQMPGPNGQQNPQMPQGLSFGSGMNGNTPQLNVTPLR